MENNCDRLIKEALFTSETRDYRIPEEPEAGDSVMIRSALEKTMPAMYLSEFMGQTF